MRSKFAVMGRIAFAAALTGTIALGVTGANAATLSSITTATGSAYGIKGSGIVTVAGTLAAVPVNIPETPTVTSTNSTTTQNKTLASAYVPSLCAFLTPTCVVNTHVVKATTRNANTGSTPGSTSSATAADVSLLFDLVKAKAIHAECAADKTGLTMSSGLVVLPSTTTVPVSAPLPIGSVPAANTVVPIGSGTTVVGTITLNEQINTSTATQNSGEVNAIHISLPAGSLLSATGVDVIVGHAACSATGTAASSQ